MQPETDRTSSRGVGPAPEVLRLQLDDGLVATIAGTSTRAPARP
ncbi:MAG: hypothetical protein WBM50_25990 [Acidimicrobiales bacterium]